MMIDSKFFIICFLAIIAFCESEELFKIKSNDTLKGQTKRLFPYYLESCNSYYNCRGDHQVCVDFICRCVPNYKYEDGTKKCEHFNCSYNSDCRGYDFNRYCSNKYCDCLSGYYEDSTNGNKCEYFYTPSSITESYYYDFTWVWILIGIVIVIVGIILILIFNRYVRRRRRYLAAVRTANLQPVTIVANTEYGTTAYQTNYFPACYPQNFNNPPLPYSIR